MIYLICFGVFIGVFALAVLTILLIGIDIRIAVNPDNGFAVVDCFVLKALFLIKIKAIVHNSEFYIKIGDGAFRRISHFKNADNIKKIKTKKFPKLTLHDVNTRVCIGVDDNPVLATAVIGAVGVLINNLEQLAHNRVRIKGYNQLLKPDFVNDSLKISLDANIKFSFIKLMFYIFSGKKVDKGEIINEH